MMVQKSNGNVISRMAIEGGEKTNKIQSSNRMTHIFRLFS